MKKLSIFFICCLAFSSSYADMKSDFENQAELISEQFDEKYQETWFWMKVYEGLSPYIGLAHIAQATVPAGWKKYHEAFKKQYNGSVEYKKVPNSDFVRTLATEKLKWVLGNPYKIIQIISQRMDSEAEAKRSQNKLQLLVKDCLSKKNLLLNMISELKAFSTFEQFNNWVKNHNSDIETCNH